MAIAVTLLLHVIQKIQTFKVLIPIICGIYLLRCCRLEYCIQESKRYQASLLTNLSPLWWALVRFLF
jgi:hypothetical protein